MKPSTGGPVMERFDGGGVFSKEDFKRVTLAFERKFDKPLPISAQGEQRCIDRWASTTATAWTWLSIPTLRTVFGCGSIWRRTTSPITLSAISSLARRPARLYPYRSSQQPADEIEINFPFPVAF